MSKLKQYVKLANDLDELGYYKEAKAVDKIIQASVKLAVDQTQFWSKVVAFYGSSQKSHPFAESGNTVLEALKNLVGRYHRKYNENIAKNIPGGLASMAEMLDRRAQERYESSGGDYNDGGFYFSFEWPDKVKNYSIECELYLVPAAS